MRHISLLAVVTAMLVEGTGFSQPSTDPETIAAQFAEAGSVALKSNDVDTAIDLFTKANAKVPTPEFLYDLGLAHRKGALLEKDRDPAKAAAHRDAAREFFHKFLDTKPQNEDLELKAQGYLAKLDQQWASEHPKEEAARRAEEARQREAAIAAEQARISEERRIREARERAERERVARAVTRTKYELSKSQAKIVKLSAYGAFAGGAVALGFGVHFGLHARDVSDQLSHSNTYDQSLIQEGEQADRDMKIAFATGGVLIGAGAATYWVARRMESRVESMVIAPTAGGAVVRVGGHF